MSGDDLMPRHRRAGRRRARSSSTSTPASAGASVGVQPITANAYLGAEPITRALAAGADVVVTGRVTDAALVIGPAAWRHGWDYAAARAGDQATLDALAGALVAGHVIECGAQATGGNYAFFTDVPGLEHPGLPHRRGRRRRQRRHHQARRARAAWSPWEPSPPSCSTRSAGPQYLNPDVTARLRDHPPRAGRPGPRAHQRHARGRAAGTAQGRDELPRRLPQLPDARHDRARCRGEGRPRPAHRGRAWRWSRRGSWLRTRRPWPPHRRSTSRELSVELDASGRDDPQLPADAQSFLRLTVKDPDARKVGKPFTAPVIEATLSSYPGLFPTTPPGPASPYGVYWPTTVSRDHVPVGGQRRRSGRWRR